MLPTATTTTSDPELPTTSQRFTQLPAVAGRRSRASEVQVPRPPPPPVLPRAPPPPPGPLGSLPELLTSKETPADPASVDHDVDMSFYDDGAEIGGYDDDGMDWAEGQGDGMDRDADEEDTEEKMREKDKLAGVRCIQSDRWGLTRRTGLSWK